MKKITIDFNKIDSVGEIHKLFKQKLNFPDYYGNNWNAFRDIITDVKMPEILEIKGWKKFMKNFKEDAKAFKEIMEEFNEISNIKCRVEYL